MPSPSIGSWWPFPPETREVQLDEKWGFVYRKEKSCALDSLDRLGVRLGPRPSITRAAAALTGTGQGEGTPASGLREIRDRGGEEDCASPAEQPV